MFPPLSAIRAVEAACRLGGFSAAAVELGISQSAVSQSIRQLERQLGVDMFLRQPGGVTPTAVGRRYAAAVAPAIAALHVAAVETQPDSTHAVALGCSRALLNHWLLPRLTRSSHENGVADVVALDRMPNQLAGFDVAIVYGRVDAPPLEGARIIRREVELPVGAPQLAKNASPTLEEAGELKSATLLGSGWQEWARQVEVELPALSAVRLRETSALMAAALAGEGFALLPSLVCADAVQKDQLVVVSSTVVDRGRCYWLVEPAGEQGHAARMVEWLTAQLAQAPGSP